MEQGLLFDVPDAWWVRRRCQVCSCALSVTFDYIYVVQRQGWIKIGGTDNPRRRINELTRPAWRKHVLYPVGMDWHSPLTVHAVVGGEVEHEIHQSFQKHHVIGEWFNDHAQIREWIEEVS